MEQQLQLRLPFLLSNFTSKHDVFRVVQSSDKLHFRCRDERNSDLRQGLCDNCTNCRAIYFAPVFYANVDANTIAIVCTNTDADTIAIFFTHIEANTVSVFFTNIHTNTIAI